MSGVIVVHPVPSSWKMVMCRSAGASRRELSDCHGVRVGGATSLAPAATSRAVVASASSTSKATRIRGATCRPTSTSSIMRFCAGVGDLQGRAAGVQDHHPRVPLAAERRLLRQAQRVAEERDGGLVVGGLHHEAQLTDNGSGRVGGHERDPSRRGEG